MTNTKLSLTPAQVTEVAAQVVIDNYGIRAETGESALNAFAFSLGGTIEYESGLVELVEAVLSVEPIITSVPGIEPSYRAAETPGSSQGGLAAVKIRLGY